MTVKELIEELKKYPALFQVKIESSNWPDTPSNTKDIKNIFIQNNDVVIEYLH